MEPSWRRPTALALVSEMSPAGKRGRLVTFTQFLWALGPLVVLLLVLIVTGLDGQLGTNGPGPGRSGLRGLFDPSLLRATLFTTAFYTVLTIGTNFYGSFVFTAWRRWAG
jgi:hypothetical protein